MNKELDKVLRELSVEKAFMHLRFLVEDVGQRLAGTEPILKAATYVKNKLSEYGLDARIDHFPIYHSYPLGAELRVLSPETKVITAKPSCHIASTLPEGIEGELVYANVGGYDDYVGKDVRGKIVLTSMTWAPPRPEKARIAHEKGAKALIIANWGPMDNPVIQMGGTKSQWGNPTPDTFKHIPQLPVISIARAGGEYLMTLCKKGPVQVWLRAEATREWVVANQPVGFLSCNENTDEFILVGSHLEAWGKTAICNSSGNSLALELARVLAKNRKQLNRNVIFGFWDGHEVAEAAGSTWFVDNNWDTLTQHCVAYVNIDNPGILGTSIPGITSVTEMKRFLTRLVSETWPRESEWHDAYKGGDASFFGIGVPYISFYTRYTQEELRELNYASLSPWLHSEADTIDKIDKDLFSQHLTFFGGLLGDLCNRPQVPYDFELLVDELEGSLRQLKELAGNTIAKELEGLDEALEEFRTTVCELQREVRTGGHPEKITYFNKALIRVSRELSSVMRSRAGRYAHDPYGYSLVGKPFPGIYFPLSKLINADRNSEEFNLWRTELIRQRNRLSDAILNATEYSNLVLRIAKTI